jgi:hypothetical protein
MVSLDRGLSDAADRAGLRIPGFDEFQAFMTILHRGMVIVSYE